MATEPQWSGPLCPVMCPHSKLEPLPEGVAQHFVVQSLPMKWKQHSSLLKHYPHFPEQTSSSTTRRSRGTFKGPSVSVRSAPRWLIQRLSAKVEASQRLGSLRTLGRHFYWAEYLHFSLPSSWVSAAQSAEGNCPNESANSPDPGQMGSLQTGTVPNIGNGKQLWDYMTLISAIKTLLSLGGLVLNIFKQYPVI